MRERLSLRAGMMSVSNFRVRGVWSGGVASPTTVVLRVELDVPITSSSSMSDSPSKGNTTCSIVLAIATDAIERRASTTTCTWTCLGQANTRLPTVAM